MKHLMLVGLTLLALQFPPPAFCCDSGPPAPKRSRRAVPGRRADHDTTRLVYVMP